MTINLAPVGFRGVEASAVLVDDHASILDSLQTLLQGADDVTAVAWFELSNGEWSSEALATILDRQRVSSYSISAYPSWTDSPSCGRWMSSSTDA